MNDTPIPLPLDRVEQLRELIKELLRVNQQFNLTAVRDEGAAWIKHVHDSLMGLTTDVFDEARRVIDVGAGAGFPGLALAIARPELEMSLVESTGKKCDFMRGAIEKFGLRAHVICERAEVAGQDKAYRSAFDVATARALGSMAEVCELTLPLVRVGGRVVLWRGEKAPAEVAASRRALGQLGGRIAGSTPYHLPGHDLLYHLVVIRKIAPTPAHFPRRVGLPKQKSL